MGLAELSPNRKRLASSVSLSDKRSSSTISSIVSSEATEALVEATEVLAEATEPTGAAVQMTLNELNLRSEEPPEQPPAADAMASNPVGKN